MNTWKLDKTFEFDGRVVRYGIVGNGQPLVMVHGTPWSSYNLRHLISGLSKTFRVHFFDLLGYGQSSLEPGDVSLGIQNRVLTALLEYWKLENAIAVGHDFGGATVLRSHLLDQAAFRKLVLVDPVAVSPWGSPFFQHVRQHETAFAGVPDYIHAAIVRAYIETATHQTIQSETLDQTVAYWTREEGKTAFYRQIAQADSKFTEEIEPLYAKIKIPVLILWGEADSWIPVEQGNKLHAMIPRSRMLTIKNAGHLVIEENPTALLREMNLFFAENNIEVSSQGTNHT